MWDVILAIALLFVAFMLSLALATGLLLPLRRTCSCPLVRLSRQDRDGFVYVVRHADACPLKEGEGTNV